MGVKGKRSIPRSGSTVTLFRGIHMYMDICGRVSTCKLCAKPILSKEDRVVISQQVMPQKTNTGGLITQRKTFLHPVCVVRYIGEYSGKELTDIERASGHDPLPRPIHAGRYPESESGCSICGNKDMSASKRAKISKRFTWLSICGECANDGTWTTCESCRTVVKRYASSALVKVADDLFSKLGPGAIICDDCQQSGEYETKKSVGQKRKAELKSLRSFELVRQELLSRLGTAPCESQEDPGVG